MSYRVKINGLIAFVENGVWKSSNGDMEKFLNSWLELKKLAATTPEDDLFWLTSPATPDPDYLIASVAANSFNGQLIDEPLTNNKPIIIDGVEVDPATIVY